MESEKASPAKLSKREADSDRSQSISFSGENTPSSSSSSPARESRPFIVWNCDRTFKRPLKAFSLMDLLLKGSEKLGLNTADVRVVLEEDGSEVDEEEYFEFLPNNCVLMLLNPGEDWLPRGHTSRRRNESVEIAETGLGVDETDHGDSGDEMDEETYQLAQDIRENMINIINFSENQLQKIADAPTEELAVQLGKSERFTKSVQDSCQRHLDDMIEKKDLVGFLKLYHEANKYFGNTQNSSAGRKRRASDAGDG